MVVQPNIDVVNYLDGYNVEAICHALSRSSGRRRLRRAVGLLDGAREIHA